MEFTLAHAVPVLERTPAVLDTLLRGIPDAWITGDEGPDTWSPFDVVGHMIDGEETDWMVRLRIIIGQGSARHFQPFDRSRHLERNKARRVADLLDEFRGLRERNLSELRSMDLGESQLRLTGEHPEFGSVTAAQLLSTWVVHDLGHLAQVSRAMAKQYRAAVGPWEAYLSILNR